MDKERTAVPPWARALIVALVLLLIAGALSVLFASPVAALFLYGAVAVAIVGGIMALMTVTRRAS